MEIICFLLGFIMSTLITIIIVLILAFGPMVRDWFKETIRVRKEYHEKKKQEFEDKDSDDKDTNDRTRIGFKY